MFHEEGITTIAYNPTNGPYIEFLEVDSGKKYHFVSQNVEEVAALLQRKEGRDSDDMNKADSDVDTDVVTSDVNANTNGNDGISDTNSNSTTNDQDVVSLLQQ